MLLSAEHLSINFGSRQLLDDVNFYLNEGDRTGIIGINGTGKSTFLKVLAGELEAVSAEHLIAAGEEGMDAMAEGGTTAMLLPATSFYLGKTFAPARTMIEKGIPVCIASDFNPGSCPSLNLQLAINLGYLRYKMTPEEILTAVTINPACAINRGNVVGSLEEGKQADIVIWNAPDMEMLCYRFGSNLAQTVIKKGEIVK